MPDGIADPKNPATQPSTTPPDPPVISHPTSPPTTTLTTSTPTTSSTSARGGGGDVVGTLTMTGVRANHVGDGGRPSQKPSAKAPAARAAPEERRGGSP